MNSSGISPAVNLQKGFSSEKKVLEENPTLSRQSLMVKQMVKSSESNFQAKIDFKNGDSLSISQSYRSFQYKGEMQLLYNSNRKSIENVFESKPETPEAIEKEEPVDLDEIVPEFANSENTANRITDFATSLLPVYLQSHGEELNEETLEGFMSLIKEAIDTGFQQAKTIISDEWQMMDDPLSALISKTYDKVQENLKEFEELMMAKINPSEDTEEIETEDEEKNNSHGIKRAYEASNQANKTGRNAAIQDRNIAA
jgi:hypothetical protein